VRLVVIPCGGSKADKAMPAALLYVGSYFRTCYKTAVALVDLPEQIRILSAKHGLLRLDEFIAPYNLKMGDPGSVAAGRVRQQAASDGLIFVRDVVLLLPREYAKVALRIWPHAKVPLAGLHGMGEQLHRLGEIRRNGLPTALERSA
jgi:hypothetical protein